MNKNFITEPKNSTLHDYYWKQIESSVNSADAADFKNYLVDNFGNNAISTKTTDELCKLSILALLTQVSQSSQDVGYALEYLKNGDINIDPSSFFNRLNKTIRKALSIKSPDLIDSKKIIDIDKLRTALNSTIKEFYDKNPNLKGQKSTVKALQHEIAKTLDNALEIQKTLNPDNSQTVTF